MRRLLIGLTALGSLLGNSAMAAQECPNENDQAAFELAALKSTLMVVATTCDDRDQYNNFIRRYQPKLQENDRSLSSYFKSHYGNRGQTEQDRYNTDLANSQSRFGLAQGTDFCARNAAMFNEVMALGSPADLPNYAAAKDLIPASIGACPGLAPLKVASTTASGKKKKH
jgi:hypothetical protein